MVSVAEWQRQLARVDADNALFGVLGFYLNGFEEDIGDISLISHDNARAGVRQMGASYPEKVPGPAASRRRLPQGHRLHLKHPQPKARSKTMSAFQPDTLIKKTPKPARSKPRWRSRPTRRASGTWWVILADSTISFRHWSTSK
nr:hypothetical protein GCM10020185_30070 [Pseudomonas brassicacearum subsp. brassicacearum]